MRYFLLTGGLLLSQMLFSKEYPAPKTSNNSILKASAGCFPATSEAELNINNVRATVLAGGDMWWDLSNPKYEIPVGSGKHSMFSGSLWIGGVDAGGQVRVAAQTYRQTGNDFWPGAIDTTVTDILSTQCQFYDSHWKINRQQVLDFVSNGTTTNAITTWPGNGNPAFNESEFLAPFFDNNGDGIYNHIDGDYPGYNLGTTYPTFQGTSLGICNDYLFGDQTIWWVINDVGNAHTRSNSQPIGLEIRCQAFAFQSNTASINNSTFYKYQVINRSSLTYIDTYFGQWTDSDLGNYIDDYVGCDVIRGLGYCYNGDADDETASGYGINPPAIGVDFLKGPDADPLDATDNDRDGCVDCTFIDSAGFTIVINDVILNEGISMSKFLYYDAGLNPATSDPNGYSDFYKYLRGLWLDNQPITYGGNGRNPANPVCNYMFPGSSDPLFPINWTEQTAGSIPEDRRFIMSAGPFTMLPGEVNYVTTAVVWARATSGGPAASVALLKIHDSEVQQLFENCFRVLGTGLDENEMETTINVYPNPGREYVNFNLKGYNEPYQIKVYNSKGEIVMISKISDSQNMQWNTENIPAGIYIYEINTEGKKIKSGKIVLN